MFRRLISDLPFNPSLIENFPAYIKTLRKRQAYLSAGILLIAVAYLFSVYFYLSSKGSVLTSAATDLTKGVQGRFVNVAVNKLPTINFWGCTVVLGAIVLFFIGCLIYNYILLREIDVIRDEYSNNRG